MEFSFASDHLRDETKAVNELLESLSWDAARARRVENLTSLLISRLKARKSSGSEIEAFLEQYPLESDEGLALMTLAEALLRIPDSETRDQLIEEKIFAADWSRDGGGDMFLKAAGTGLSLAKKTLGSFLGAIGRPVIRKSLEEAVRRIGRQFVIGEMIDKAIREGVDLESKGSRLSYDMLGEGARTFEDAERYYQSYLNAIRAIGEAGRGTPEKRSAMSVKLSALHPRYVWAQADSCVPSITEKLLRLCDIAAQYDMGLTIDAEESDRLELSLYIIDAVCAAAPKNWDGLGLAVQAYDKRNFRLIDDVYKMAQRHGRRLQVRLVKGAYWDTEIKRAQMAGFANYSVYTRKVNTDISYLAAAQKLLSYRDYLYPMFATHNAQTVAAVMDLAGDDRRGFEFQRLYGMGQGLADIMQDEGMAQMCVYAPVGSYDDLLPYLVRRMLENGANTSFVHQLRAESDASALADDFIARVKKREDHAHAHIPLPRYLYPDRINSTAPDFSTAKTRQDLDSKTIRLHGAQCIIGGENPPRANAPIRIPLPASIGENGGEVWEVSLSAIETAFVVSRKGFGAWAKREVKDRSDILRRIADGIEKNRDELIGILRSEGGKTLADAIAEIREAADFCRYYALHAEKLFATQLLNGPTGETNNLSVTPRGIFVCISPWNFPLAIFTGQIVAALVTGNAVIAKPAEQTPVIAYMAIRIMHDAGVPRDVLHLILGDGKIGASLVSYKNTAGVVFTGSTEIARTINKTLANKDGPIVPLIAETGGQNAMIVDSSALLETAIDDLILSAFGSAGQRCSALRVVYVQDDIADRFVELLKGAIVPLHVGDPRRFDTDIGPVIDEGALRNLQQHEAYLSGFARLIARADKPNGLNGYYFAPVAYEIKSLSQLRGEVFGPVLHVIRYRAKDLDKVIDEINATGYGLTFGLHSRLSGRFEELAHRIQAGNIYINRSMTGAVVGVQPFGGMGLSGTGPKAGGPHYLARFVNERAVTVNITASGGNVNLISLEDK